MSASTTTLTMASDEEIVIRRVFDAPRQLVFEAHTKPEHLTQWLLGPEGWTMPVCEIDLRPGGSWHFAWQQADGRKLEMSGVYREVVAPGADRQHRAVGSGMARNRQHDLVQRTRGGDDGHPDRPLPIESGPRRGAGYRHDERHRAQLRPPRRIAPKAVLSAGALRWRMLTQERRAGRHQGWRPARTQNSFPSGSARQTQLSSPVWPTSACRAPRSRRRRTSSSCSRSVGLTSRWTLFLTILPSGTCANVKVGGTGPRRFFPSGTAGEPMVITPLWSFCTS